MADMTVRRNDLSNAAGAPIMKLKDMGDGTHAEVFVAVALDSGGDPSEALPAGRAAASASVPTVMSNEDLAATLPARTVTDRSITAGVAAANAMAANASRRGWKIKNDTAIDIWVNFIGAATAVAGSGNMKVAANGGYLASEPACVETGAMSIIAASGTPAVTILEFS